MKILLAVLFFIQIKSLKSQNDAPPVVVPAVQYGGINQLDSALNRTQRQYTNQRPVGYQYNYGAQRPAVYQQQVYRTQYPYRRHGYGRTAARIGGGIVAAIVIACLLACCACFSVCYYLFSRGKRTAGAETGGGWFSGAPTVYRTDQPAPGGYYTTGGATTYPAGYTTSYPVTSYEQTTTYRTDNPNYYTSSTVTREFR